MVSQIQSEDETMNSRPRMFTRPNRRVKELIHCLKAEAENSAYMFVRIQFNLGGIQTKLISYKKVDAAIEKITS